MKIMCIWTKDKADNIMKVVRSKSEMKNAKLGGRQPDKIITRTSEMKPFSLKQLKSYVSYDGMVFVDDKIAYHKAGGIL